MIEFIRSLFGWNGSAAGRKVVGKQASIDIKDIPYIQDSNNRLNLLHNLINRYKNTPHAPKIKAIYEKTKKLHSYLVAQRKVRELELFHIQNTDNFINTFTAILDAHQRKQEQNSDAWKTDSEKKLAPVNNSPESANHFLKSEDIPQIAVTTISINTFTKLTYESVDTEDNIALNEISTTATRQDKETFLATISPRLGVYKLDISYVGNAQVKLINSHGSGQMETVPVINWRGCLYVFSLKDYRLFPVRINRKQAL